MKFLNLSRAASRRSKTPTLKSRPMSRHGSRRCTTPTSLSRSSSSLGSESIYIIGCSLNAQVSQSLQFR
ncbi:hypothetical protein JHK85_019188 [Glycine max]|nr:hypothetical protein JHK85_019188 [Glycine max]